MFPERLKKKQNWVVWKKEPDAKGNPTKVPYQTNGYKASSTKSASWTTYENAKKAAATGKFDGIGLVFDGTFLGVDLDHILTHKRPEAKKFVQEANSYTEKSPSGDGLHVFLALSETLNIETHAYKPDADTKYECYTEKRYFTVTENGLKKYPTLRTVDAVEAVRLLSILGYPWKSAPKDSKPNTLPKTQLQGLPEDRILDVMFRAKNGDAMRRLYEGDLSDYKDDHSVADLVLCKAFAFYSANNAAVIEKLWRASPLAQREKMQKHPTYVPMTVAKAIEFTTKTFTADKSFDNAEKWIVKTNKNGDVTIAVCTENIQIFLEANPEIVGEFRFDAFRHVVEYRMETTKDWRSLRDIDAIMIQAKIAHTHPFFATVPKQMVYDAILANAERHSFDPAIEYFTSLKWDEKPRLDSWLHSVYGVEDNDYHRAIGANWIKGMVNRVMRPGCKFDYVLVLEGEQGIKKSLSLATLGGPWHVETVLTPDTKDFFMTFFGNMIVEFAEGETLSRSEVKKLKSVITMQHDDIRLPFERAITRLHRRCVFAMTTNEDTYLKDDTGNRRWLPVHVMLNDINIAWLEENRDQLFAEAFHRVFMKKEKYWEFPKEQMEEEQEKRKVIDPRAELIGEWYAQLTFEQQNQGITTRQAFEATVPMTTFSTPHMSRLDEIQIGAILRHTLKLHRTVRTIGGVRRNAYIPSQKTPRALPIETEQINQTF